MKPRVCETCHRPLPMDDIAGMLPPVKRRIYEAIAEAGARGLSRDEIMDRVYEDRIDGGPERSDRVKVNICQINRLIRPRGFNLKWESGQYRLENYG